MLEIGGVPDLEEDRTYLSGAPKGGGFDQQVVFQNFHLVVSLVLAVSSKYWKL